MARMYEQPKQPSDWKKTDERTFYSQLIEVLDELHLPITEDALSDKVRSKLQNAADYKRIDYKDEVQDTGIKWLDGSPVKRITSTFNVTANVDATSPEIHDLGAIVDVKGFVLTSSGACYPVGNGVVVWKSSQGTTYKVNSPYTGEANITVYFIEQAIPPTPTGIYELYKDGYINDIAWRGNMLVRPQFTQQGAVDMTHAEDSYMMPLISGGGGGTYYHNAHVCTAETVVVPGDATKMCVEASKGVYNSTMVFGLLTENYVNSMDASRGGQLTGKLTVDSKKVFTMNLADGITGNEFRAVVNIYGIGNRYTELHVHKVYFE